MPFLYPLHHTWERPYVGAGLVLYDGMAASGAAKYEMGVPRHKHLFRKQLARIAPDLRTDDLVGAIRYYDCQVDDARLVMNDRPHRSGVRRPRGLAHQGDRLPPRGRPGRRRAAWMDLENDREIEVRAQVVVNAGGVWTNEIQEMLGGRGALDVEASKGDPPRRAARPDPQRVRLHHQDREVRAVRDPVGPALDHRHHRHPVGPRPRPPGGVAADIDYVLGHVNKLLRTPLDHDDVEGVYAGLRPLLRGATEPTSKISREHTVAAPLPGLVMIAGGKLTTYRVMAQDAVDAARVARRRPGRRASPTGCRCSVPPASRRAPTSASRSPAPAASTSRASTTCSAATAAWSTRCSS